MAQAREDCRRGDWHDNDLSRASQDVQAFRTTQSHAGAAAAVGGQVTGYAGPGAAI